MTAARHRRKFVKPPPPEPRGTMYSTVSRRIQAGTADKPLAHEGVVPGATRITPGCPLCGALGGVDRLAGDPNCPCCGPAHEADARFM